MKMSRRLESLFPRYPMLLGHRGCSAVAPENTIPAFQKILEYQIPGVELDVQQCRSGELLVIHDSNLKRITGLDALVSETDYSEIRKLDAGSWFSEAFSGEHILLLDEVLEFLGNRVIIDIEIKHWKKQCGELEKALAEAVQRHNLTETAVVSSFNPWAVKAVKSFDSKLITALIYTDYEEFPQWLSDGSGRYVCEPDFLKPNRLKINSDLINLEQEGKNIPLITWTEDDPEVVRSFLEMGISGVITNKPEELLPMFSERWEKL
ncbi:MAG: glycerophosphodiester phosphodiesterase [Spirochaetales bacterium]|nr:glycerophosphodiester phosphodiesterase [Spirochaetales bacterium]